MAPNRVIGCLQTPGASWRRALRGFFSGKKASKNQRIHIHYKICVFVCFCKKNFVVYHDQGRDQGHDQGHDHDLDHHDLDHDLGHDLDHDEDEKSHMNKVYQKGVHKITPNGREIICVLCVYDMCIMRV